MSITLHAARDVDLGALAQAHAACFPDEAWDSAALATILAMAGTEGHIARSGTGAICGLLITQRLGEDAEILTLGVLPGERRRGIATTLLEHFLAQARAAGAAHIMLEVAADNAAALALYRSLGFVHDGTRRNYYRRAAGTSMDAWRFRLEIVRPNAG